MVRGATLALQFALTWLCCVNASVLVPTYVLPPDSFLREQRSLGNIPDTAASESQRTIKRLIGGHLKIKSDKEYGDAKNSIVFNEKKESEKFKTIIAPESSGGITVGWNQGVWDDGMLMSSAGEGRENTKTKEIDEDKKTLADQVAEGKYGLIQNEIFPNPPKRPGIVSYKPNTETRSKDNIQTLGGLTKDEIWLAEDHLLVLAGGSFPEKSKESEKGPWAPIDAYEAPRRQVKLPEKPKVPPPFPVQLYDNGPLIFLTPNGSVPASFFPPFPEEGENPVPPPTFSSAAGAAYAPSENSGNSPSGGAPLPIPPFPFLPGNANEGTPPYPTSMNGSFPEGFPPGAVFLPPPSNQSDLYDEDDPSIYYPPPYNFSYHADYNNSVPAGPLVPGIILPPPPDFFAPMEETTTMETEIIRTKSRPTTTVTYTKPKSTSKRPLPATSYRTTKYKTRPPTTEKVATTEAPFTVTEPPLPETTTLNTKKPQRIIQIPSRIPVGVKDSSDNIITKPEQTYKTRTKLTSKPLTVSVIYDYPDNINDKVQKTPENPYLVYKIPDNKHKAINENSITSTSIPLRSYYSKSQNNEVPTTKLQPVYNKNPSNAVTSFYFYEEQPKTSTIPGSFFDGRTYYSTVTQRPAAQDHSVNTQSGFAPSVDVTYGALDQSDALFLWPQKQGSRTLTQEYFSIQKPQIPFYLQQQKKQPDHFFQQIADIQQTIELFSTKRPKLQTQRTRQHKGKSINSRPVYQFNYQTKQRPDPYTFRAPKLDPEPFRPMVSYSKPFNVDNEFNAVTPTLSPGHHQQFLVEKVQVTTENPASTGYYPKTKLIDYDYNDTPIDKYNQPKQNINHIPSHSNKPSTSRHVTRVQSTTPNPISHAYYTKQDERYFDDITKNSFNIFGQKIEDSTPSLRVTESLGTVRTPIDNDINLKYAYEFIEPQNPSPKPSLEGDTLVNDRYPRPPIEPDSESIVPHTGNANADLLEPVQITSLLGDTLVNEKFPRPPNDPNSEFIPIPNPEYRSLQYRLQNQVQSPQFTGEQDDLNQPSLGGDIAVNYKRPLPPVNPDAEWIAPVVRRPAGEGKPGSFVSYRLPGEGAHVYFLTPQATQTRERYRSPGYRR